MSARLVITTEEGVRLELTLGAQPVTIGRAEDNTVRSADRRTSRHHAIIRRREDGSFEVEDGGSSYGTLLNGKAAQREPLGHLDQLQLGGIQVQFHDEPEVSTEPGAEEILAERFELREQVRKLIDEQAGLRQVVGELRDALKLAERQRDAEHGEAVGLRETAAGQQDEIARLKARIDTLGNELRNERGGAGAASVIDEAAVAQLQRELAEAQKQQERQRARVEEIEQREAKLHASEQALKKENERLLEMNQRHEKRAAELQLAVKPALLRIAQLSDEMEKMRVQLAQAQADLEHARKGR